MISNGDRIDIVKNDYYSLISNNNKVDIEGPYQTLQLTNPS